MTFKRVLRVLCSSTLLVLATFTAVNAQPFAYVVRQEDSNEVVVIDTSTNSIVTTIPSGGRGSFRADSNPNGAFVYITNIASNDVSVIDTATNTVVTTIPVGPFPLDVAFTPDGAFAYVTSPGSNTVIVIDAAAHAVVDTLPLQFPNIVDVSPDGEFAYVTTFTAGGAAVGTLAVIDTDTNTIIDTIVLGGEPQGVTFSPTQNIAYVTDLNGARVWVIDTATHSLITTVPVGLFPVSIVFTPNGAFAYVVNGGSRTVSVIRTSDHSVIATIPVGADAFGIDITPDGEFVYVTNLPEHTVSVISTDTNTVVNTIFVGGPNLLGDVTIAPLPSPLSIDQCKQGGYLRFRNPAFKNQGQCVKFVNDRLHRR